MNTQEIFNETARRVIESGATENAKAFATKVRDRILANGDEWIEKNKFALEISQLNFSKYADGSGEIAPIEDNRLFYLQKWQMVLAGGR
ncbi:MAG: hypothetical protein Q8M07_02650 [Prosthecobacter sp.]|nr:hypothetical protein [Prosthecobacter sp.]